ncbi:MAG: DUF6456 domain-containing protein [Pseudomonadota bacterium]
MGNKKTTELKAQRQWCRLAKLLATRVESGFEYYQTGSGIKLKASDREFIFASELLELMVQNAHAKLLLGRVKITPAGLMELKNKLGLSFEESQLSPKSVAAKQVLDPSGHRTQVNSHESPLLRLYSRKTHKGSSYISENQLKAGEQLRRDFERGQLQPKISANLDRSLGTAGKTGASSAANEISDFAIDARARVNRAIDVLGPDLSGATIDICCFLKGLELVERERQWPPRSAKLMLRTALSMLAKHYGFEPRSGAEQHKIRFWGDEGYRPNLSA